MRDIWSCLELLDVSAFTPNIMRCTGGLQFGADGEDTTASTKVRYNCDGRECDKEDHKHDRLLLLVREVVWAIERRLLGISDDLSDIGFGEYQRNVVDLRTEATKLLCVQAEVDANAVNSNSQNRDDRTSECPSSAIRLNSDHDGLDAGGEEVVFVAVGPNDDVIGVVSISDFMYTPENANASLRRERRYLLIASIAVDERARGRSVANRLLRKIEQVGGIRHRGGRMYNGLAALPLDVRIDTYLRWANFTPISEDELFWWRPLC